MYVIHNSFIQPSNLDAKIWRYLNFTKYVALLDRKALYFRRANLLSDPFEGSFPMGNIRNRTKLYEKMEVELPTKNKIQVKDIPIRIRNYTYINCWCMNDYESAAMWNIYSKDENGIVIRSSFRSLCDSFAAFKEDIYIGKIVYIDYEKESIPEDNILRPFLFKRKSYEHESEIRAVLMRWIVKEGKYDLYCQPKSEGEYVNIKLSVLIDKVFVSPSSKKWFYELVKSVTKLYSLDKEIIFSDLSKDAFF
jgi:hypothetical protein